MYLKPLARFAPFRRPRIKEIVRPAQWLVSNPHPPAYASVVMPTWRSQTYQRSPVFCNRPMYCRGALVFSQKGRLLNDYFVLLCMCVHAEVDPEQLNVYEQSHITRKIICQPSRGKEKLIVPRSISIYMYVGISPK